MNFLFVNMLQGPLAPEPSGCEQRNTLCTQKEKRFPSVVGGRVADGLETPQMIWKSCVLPKTVYRAGAKESLVCPLVAWTNVKIELCWQVLVPPW